MLVDTTVWIDFFRGRAAGHVSELRRVIAAGEDVCVCGVILTEVLQGIRDDRDHARVSTLFDEFLFLPMSRQAFVRAAAIYRTLRQQGVTIRNAVDCMIAAVAIEHAVPLLHNDRDFDKIASLGELILTHPKETR